MSSENLPFFKVLIMFVGNAKHEHIKKSLVKDV